jgi:hypothetical protein
VIPALQAAQGSVKKMQSYPSCVLVANFYIFELKIDYIIKSMLYKRIGQDVKEN